jgi:hypothetical protein
MGGKRGKGNMELEGSIMPWPVHCGPHSTYSEHMFVNIIGFVSYFMFHMYELFNTNVYMSA